MTSLGQLAASPLAWPIRAACAALGSGTALPSPEELDAALAHRARVRFVAAAPRGRRRVRGDEPKYDARIVDRGEVPTRPGVLHDVTNALVWASFPRSKRSLHARQQKLVVPSRSGESQRRPRALDALALIDEGGAIVVVPEELAGADEAAIADAAAAGRVTVALFGHALYEGLVSGWPAPTASAVVFAGDVVRAEPASLEALDARLVAYLEDPENLREPRDLSRIFLGQALGWPDAVAGTSAPSAGTASLRP